MRRTALRPPLIGKALCRTPRLHGYRVIARMALRDRLDWRPDDSRPLSRAAIRASEASASGRRAGGGGEAGSCQCGSPASGSATPSGQPSRDLARRLEGISQHSRQRSVAHHSSLAGRARPRRSARRLLPGVGMQPENRVPTHPGEILREELLAPLG